MLGEMAPLLLVAATAMNLGPLVLDPDNQTLVMRDARDSVELRLSYGGKCMLDRVLVKGREVTPPETGVCSAVKVGGQWYTTRSCGTPSVDVHGDTATVSGIRFGGGGVSVEETWTFKTGGAHIDWHIGRRYVRGGTLDDTYFPGWDFNEQSWDGALLGTGGVAWFRLLDDPVTAYGVHTGDVVLWNKASDDCLSIKQRSMPGHIAVRFSHHPSQVFSFSTSVPDEELRPKKDQYRFYRDSQEVWAPFNVEAGERASVDLELAASSYSQRYDRGRLAGLDGDSVRDICNTIARLGIIDRNVVGTNGWYSGYVCLHEQWTADLGLAIDDPNAFESCAASLDYWRDHAIGPDGRVKSRWAYGPYDCMPGTYDSNGFYEAQWGWLMDSQPCYVTDVAEQFQYSGDKAWVRGHKAACEKALDYLLARDFDGNGLVKMKNDTLTQKRSSDWIDIVWASYENGYVNVELYNALLRWAEVEQILGDEVSAARYTRAAAKLKTAFNRPVSEGGLWDPVHQCYAHWREKDGSIHGTNMVTPVNFMAVAYGLCDDLARKAAILDGIEAQMQKEHLFMWPLCMSSYTPEEGGGGPFPTYENGDIFVGWAELGMRAYIDYKPGIAVRIVRNVLAQYAKDGLAFQRYLRASQKGAGDDILASMCSPIVGLYRDVYGILPRWNRLQLDPHLTPDLAGTTLRYRLRGLDYTISLSPGDYAVSANGNWVRAHEPFGVDFGNGALRFFHRTDASAAMEIDGKEVGLSVEKWLPENRAWTVTSSSTRLSVEVHGLEPSSIARVTIDGRRTVRYRVDGTGRLRFEAAPGRFELS